MKDAYKYVVREVGYNFEDVNAFKGRPIEEVDEAWDHLLNGRKTSSGGSPEHDSLTDCTAHELLVFQ